MSPTIRYPGRVTPDPDSFIGENNRFFRPVEHTYDAESDSTTVRYERVPIEEMGSRYGHLVDELPGWASGLNFWEGQR